MRWCKMIDFALLVTPTGSEPRRDSTHKVLELASDARTKTTKTVDIVPAMATDVIYDDDMAFSGQGSAIVRVLQFWGKINSKNNFIRI